MTEVIKESLLDKLLKSRYPLTDYLHRQQKFTKLFLITQADTTSVPNECRVSSIRRRKTPHPSYYNKADTIHLQVPESNDAQSDQDYNTAHDRSSETDNDDDDARPLSKYSLK